MTKIAKGFWVGAYKFDKRAHQDLMGFEETNFEILIQSIDNDYFKGSTRDDLSTGGIEGIGEITGKVGDGKIEFIRQMPILTLIMDKKGRRKTFNKKHPKIYYFGTFSPERKSISGHWQIKFGIVWIGILPVPIMPFQGSWIMTLKD